MVDWMYDIVFLHPPSSFEKLKYPMSGVFGALVGSTDVLGHEPVGMISMAHDLSRRGYKTKVFNLGKILLESRYRGASDTAKIRDFVKRLTANIYGIGLHWAAHAPGAIELARLIKQYHPHSVVLLGGISSTYFHMEIMERFPFIDLVVLAEVDGIIHEIVDMLLSEQPHESVPNICYRKNGEVVCTALRPPVKNNLFYVRGRENELIEPNSDFSKGSQDYIRDCMIPLVYGCPCSCAFCGGSGYFYKKYFCRNRAEVMSAEQAVANIKESIRQGASGISLFGDVRFLGDRYWQELTQRLAHEHMHFDLYLELFSPATQEYMQAWGNVTSGRVIMALSPESADADVRQALGKNYSNEDIINQVALAADLGIGLSLGFMFALPKQDFDSIKGTQGFINDLCYRFNRWISYMFEPFLFIDPGSLIFDDPERYGYEVKDRSLEGLIKSLTRPHWYYSLDYSTKWMNKKEIIEAMFFIGTARNELYLEFVGPSERNLFHRRLMAEQRELVEIFEQNPGLTDKEIEQIIQRTVDEQFRQMNFSITGPDFDVVQQTGNEYSISTVFANTVRMISMCYKETTGDKDLLAILEATGFFDEEISVETYTEKVVREMETGKEIREIWFKPPSKIWNRFHELVSTLGLSLERGLVQEFVKYDWTLFVVNLYADIRLKHLFEKRTLPDDIRQSDVLLPLKNAYVKLNYKHDGKVVRKRNWLTLEKGQTYLLISYSSGAYPVDGNVFSFLRRCGHRMPFLEFYKKATAFVAEPEQFLEWLLTHGFILFVPGA
jgi:B12-binding domain/radical SAM domain protein